MNLSKDKVTEIFYYLKSNSGSKVKGEWQLMK